MRVALFLVVSMLLASIPMAAAQNDSGDDAAWPETQLIVMFT